MGGREGAKEMVLEWVQYEKNDQAGEELLGD